MKSVHLTNSYHPTSGGVRTMYAAMLDAANRLGRPLRLIVPGPAPGIEDVGAYGRIYFVKAPRARSIDTRYRLILPASYLWEAESSVLSILRREQPDLIEICDKYSLFYVAGLVRKAWMRGVGRPTLIGTSAERLDDNMRAFVSNGRPARLFAGWYMRHIYTPMFDYHVANSEYTAEELRAALPPHRQRVVHIAPPGVDQSAFVAADERLTAGAVFRQQLDLPPGEATLLLYAGRLSPEKNLGLLLGTLRELIAGEAEDGRRHYLVVAGDGPLRGELEREAERDMRGRVKFLGNISDRQALSAILAGADVFVHPNPREPFGIAPLEAMAACLPLVAPDSGGVLTYASAQEAWLTSPAPDAFARCVRHILARPERTSVRVSRARARAEAFHMTARVNGLFQLYDWLHDDRLRGAHEHEDDRRRLTPARGQLLPDFPGADRS